MNEINSPFYSIPMIYQTIGLVKCNDNLKIEQVISQQEFAYSEGLWAIMVVEIITFRETLNNLFWFHEKNAILWD